jgi:two-component system, OmpR family, sensor histidine kinase KdpD
VRTPDDVLRALILSNYLQRINRAAILIFDQPWADDPPRTLRALASWRSNASLASIAGRVFPLREYGFANLFAREQPAHVEDVRTSAAVNPTARTLFDSLNTRSVIAFPLVAASQWYGMLTLHSDTPSPIGDDDMRHLRGLADQAAVAIYNIRLLETEAEARREAEAANDLKLKFLAMISHELRTPLTSIKGFATTLLADDVQWSADDQRDFIQTINAEADKLTDMIDQLLDLSRLQAGSLRINPAPHTIDRILSTAMAQLQALTRNHALQIEVPADLPPVLADPQRVAQVLANLVSNAAKYSPPQSAINLSARHVDGQVEIDVSDEGPGVQPEDRAQVFEAFRRGSSNRAQHTKGAGLGLAICKGLVEAHGGRIWIQDRPGPGATFSFTLPLSNAKLASAEDAAHPVGSPA